MPADLMRASYSDRELTSIGNDIPSWITSSEGSAGPMSARLTVASVEDAITKTKSERSLRFFLEHVYWPTIEPLTTFRPGWHLDAMCDHAQALCEHKNLARLRRRAPATDSSLTRAFSAHDKEIRGKPLSSKQQGFFGAIAAMSKKGKK